MTEFEEWGEQIESQNLYLKHYQLVTCASIVILMQLGFTFLEVIWLIQTLVFLLAKALYLTEVKTA